MRAYPPSYSRLAAHYVRLFRHFHFFRPAPEERFFPDTEKQVLNASRTDAKVLLAELSSRETGLSRREEMERQATFGPNEIALEKPFPWWKALWLSYCNPFSLLLTALAIISFFTDDKPGALVISGMVLLATLLRFIQERRAHEAAVGLKALITHTSTVLRGDDPASPAPAAQVADAAVQPERSRKTELPSKDLVPGDIVILSSGDIIPADMRLLKAKDLLVNQSMLTGESLPVEKSAAPGSLSGSALDMPNLCFMGTNVVSGSAVGVVFSTGMSTYFGQIAERLGTAKREPTQFQLGVNTVSRMLLSFMAVMAPFVLFINGFTKGNWMEAALFALSVAVGLTPEMLPMIVASTLSKGAVLLSRKKVVVKRLDAIQDFGAMDILCTDKTGTLTQGKIALSRYSDPFGLDDERPLEIGYLNSCFQTGLKNEMDAAIVESGDGKGMRRLCSDWKKFDELPFDFTRRRMSVALERDGERILICKGAVEETLAVCAHVRQGEKDLPLTPEFLSRTRSLTADWNRQGLRVVAVAVKKLESSGEAPLTLADEAGLTLTGYMAFLDPPKETSAAALQALQRNGVVIKILTGDNELVAGKICSDVGLEVAGTLMGADIDAMSDEALAGAAEKADLFAKLSPLHKERLIRALRGARHVVGFMGDGINDAPALHAADVGISVNTAVDVAKDAADLILLEKSLLVLDEGVVEGRKIFANMLKYIKMTVSSNFGNVFSVLAAGIALPFLPMLPLHLLILNLFYDISQVAVPFDNVDKELLAKPQRWDTAGIRRFMLVFGPISSIFDILTFCLLWFVFKASSPDMQTLFQSGWFVESLITQAFIVHIIRTRKIPFIQSRASWSLSVATLTAAALGIWVVMGPLASNVKLQALPPVYFLWVVVILFSYISLAQLVKGWYFRRYGWQ